MLFSIYKDRRGNYSDRFRSLEICIVFPGFVELNRLCRAGKFSRSGALRKQSAAHSEACVHRLRSSSRSDINTPPARDSNREFSR